MKKMASKPLEQAEFLENSPASNQWKIIPIKPYHGINVPLFSLRSKESCGIGEFTDLPPLFDWCQELGFHVIQLLPLNDNGLDPSPYNAISAFALNPLHLGLRFLPRVGKYPDLVAMIVDMRQHNNSQYIDYKQVRDKKTIFLTEYYLREFDAIASTDSYRTFIKENEWLQGYALFKTLKKMSNWESWQTWHDDIKFPSQQTLIYLFDYYKKEIDLQIFIQYLCFYQFSEMKKSAIAKGIFLKGDIPILISSESADVWLHRSLFIMEYSAGAPPDMYSLEGQNWGFPIYNWAEMENQNYQWWRERLRIASQFYHLYRIDHIVGFFRIWAIPYAKKAKDGKFVPEDSNVWIKQGKKILTVMLNSSPLLPIGEDLGTVPTEVRKCLHALGICGTKVMRWERAWNQDKHFIKPEDYPLDSMTTISTHDSETLPQWWRDHPDEAMAYALLKEWDYQPTLSSEQSQTLLWDSHHTGSLFHINLLQEYLTLVPGMAWGKPEDERINIPGIISERNWTYRFRPFVEQIVQSSALKQIMRSVIATP